MRHVCGGAILNNKWILTAAHCIVNRKLIPKCNFYIKAGIVSLYESGIILKINRTVIHPKYKGGSTVGPYDIALVELIDTLNFDEKLQPIKLPSQNENFTGIATLSGWGLTDDNIKGQHTHSLQMADLPIISTKDCAEVISASSTLSIDYNSNICTGPMTGEVAACFGDSGSPLVIKNENNDSIQIGIVSWSLTSKNDFCHSKNVPSGVYTKVSSFIDFINKYIN